jgi:hypothetical protein
MRDESQARPGIPTSTEFHWRQKWESDPGWWSWTVPCSTAQRICTGDEEQELCDFIQQVFVRRRRLLTNCSFKAYAMQAFPSKHHANSEPASFIALDAVVHRFERRNALLPMMQPEEPIKN